ncbi:MAG: META domain-containing protein [Solirubrobacterales bacterium]
MRGGLVGIVLALAPLGGAACGSADSASDPAGGYFGVVSVAGPGGEEIPVPEPQELRVSFEDDGGGVGWTAGCNVNGARTEILPSRVEVQLDFGTEVACGSGMRAENWFTDFIGEDPEWQMDGSSLTLITDRAVVELEATDRPEE